jgi:vitamin B12 transporter
MIERIEILHGGASRVHGVGAMTGVINIVLKKAQTKLNGGYRTAAGAHGLQQHALNVGLKVGKWGALVGMQRDQSSGYVNNTDFESDRFTLALERDVTFLGFQGGLSLLYAENQKAFGAADYYTTTFPDQFEATTTTLFGTSLKLAKNKLSYALDLNYVGGTDRFELYRQTPGQGGFDASYVAYQFDLIPPGSIAQRRRIPQQLGIPGHNHHRTGAYTINERVTYEWNPLHTSTAGINLRHDDIRSNALGTSAIINEDNSRMAWDLHAIPEINSTSAISWSTAIPLDRCVLPRV